MLGSMPDAIIKEWVSYRSIRYIKREYGYSNNYAYALIRRKYQIRFIFNGKRLNSAINRVSYYLWSEIRAFGYGRNFPEDDDDANTAQPAGKIELISEEQLSQLCDLIDNNKVNKPKFLAFVKLVKLEDMIKPDFQKNLIALQNIIKAGKP